MIDVFWNCAKKMGRGQCRFGKYFVLSTFFVTFVTKKKQRSDQACVTHVPPSMKW